MECARCNTRGRSVSLITLRAQVARAKDDSGSFFFCATSTCPVVYFDETHRIEYVIDDLPQAVFQKSTNPSRLVCYCFEHSVESLLAEVQAVGESTAATSIGAQCRAGFDRCEEKNPQGRCCLGNVRAVVKPVLRLAKRSTPMACCDEAAGCGAQRKTTK